MAEVGFDSRARIFFQDEEEKKKKNFNDGITPKLHFKGLKRCKPCSLILSVWKGRQLPGNVENREKDGCTNFKQSRVQEA